MLVGLAIATPESRPAAHNRQSQVTWTTDVESILQRRCVGCHAAGGFGPMSLASYQDARTWATAIRREVLERRMPPWPAARGFGDYLNDRSLTPIEVELLTAWADGLTPIGPSVAQSARVDGSSHQHADLVIEEPADRTVTGRVDRIELATGLTADRWMSGWEFRPGNRSIVEQAVVWILPATNIGRSEAGVDVRGKGAPGVDMLGAWTPSDGPVVYPVGIAQRLPAGSRIALELHYRKSARPEVDRSGVAFRFGARPAHEVRHRSLACGAAAIDRDVEALAVTPRAQEAGASIEIVARRADESIEPLTVVPSYQPAYPITYRFRKGIPLRRGTTIDVRSSVAGCSADLEFVARR